MTIREGLSMKSVIYLGIYKIHDQLNNKNTLLTLQPWWLVTIKVHNKVGISIKKVEKKIKKCSSKQDFLIL